MDDGQIVANLRDEESRGVEPILRQLATQECQQRISIGRDAQTREPYRRRLVAVDGRIARLDGLVGFPAGGIASQQFLHVLLQLRCIQRIDISAEGRQISFCRTMPPFRTRNHKHTCHHQWQHKRLYPKVHLIPIHIYRPHRNAASR